MKKNTHASRRGEQVTSVRQGFGTAYKVGREATERGRATATGRNRQKEIAYGSILLYNN